MAINALKYVSDKYVVVSSANRWYITSSKVKDMLFRYKTNKRGPNVLAYGSPTSIYNNNNFSSAGQITLQPI